MLQVDFFQRKCRLLRVEGWCGTSSGCSKTRRQVETSPARQPFGFDGLSLLVVDMLEHETRRLVAFGKIFDLQDF